MQRRLLRSFPIFRIVYGGFGTSLVAAPIATPAAAVQRTLGLVMANSVLKHSQYKKRSLLNAGSK